MRRVERLFFRSHKRRLEPATWSETAFRMVIDALALCIVLAGILILIAPWKPRFRSIRPGEADFQTALEKLCAKGGDRWRYVVVHHSATTGGGAAAFARYHEFSKGWDALAYHFVIGNGTQTEDGEIEVGPRWERQEAGSHAGVLEYNEHGIGICLVGDFTRQRPTVLQMRSLEALARCLMRRCNIPPENVVGHRECPGAATECPGANMDMDALRRTLGSLSDSP